MEAKKWQSAPVIAAVATICGLLWGSAFPTLKIGYQELQMAADDVYAKMVFAGVRFLLAGLAILIFAQARRPGTVLSRAKGYWRPILVMGLVNTTMQYFFFYNGLAHATGVTSSIMVGMGTFLTALFAHFYYPDDSLNRRKIAGLALGMSGVAMVALSKGSLSLSVSWQGEGFLLVAVTAGAIASIMAKEVGKRMDVLTATGLQMIFGALVLLLAGLARMAPGSIQWTGFGIVLLLYTSVISAVAFGLWYSLLVHNKAGEVSLYKFLIPIFGSLLSALVLGETFTAVHGVALVLVVMGIWMVNGNGTHRRMTDGSIS